MLRRLCVNVGLLNRWYDIQPGANAVSYTHTHTYNLTQSNRTPVTGRLCFWLPPHFPTLPSIFQFVSPTVNLINPWSLYYYCSITIPTRLFGALEEKEGISLSLALSSSVCNCWLQAQSALVWKNKQHSKSWLRPSNLLGLSLIFPTSFCGCKKQMFYLAN